MKQAEEILNRWRTTRNVTESGALFTAVEELRKVFNAGQQCIEMYQHPFAQIAHSRCKLDAGHEGMHNSGTYRWLNMPHPAAVEMPEMCSSKAADGATACDYTKGHTGPHRNVQAYKEWKGSTVMAEEFLRVRDLKEVAKLRSAINGAVLENDRLREELHRIDEVLTKTTNMSRMDAINELVMELTEVKHALGRFAIEPASQGVAMVVGRVNALEAELAKRPPAVEPIPLEELEYMATTVRSFYETHGCRAAWMQEKMAEALEDGGKLLRLFNDVELTKRLLSVAGTPLSVLMTLQTEDK